MIQQQFDFHYDFSSVVDQEFTFEKFYRYYKKTSSTSMEKKSRRAFLASFYDDLKEKLSTGTYRPSAYSCFYIRTPKPREVFAPHYDDRIIHHLLVDMLSLIKSSFIHDSFANQEGKGTHRAIERAQLFMRKCEDGGMCLKCDIRSFFSSINKDILFAIVKKHLDKRNLHGEKRKLIDFLLHAIIFHDVTDNPNYTNGAKFRGQVPKDKSLFSGKKDTGIPIGSLTSQFFALVYLNELDHFIKRVLKVKHYVRYVDDFVIIEEDAGNFKRYKDEINLFLRNNLKLELHPNKISVQPCRNGIDFLGYIVRPHYLLVRNRTVGTFKAKLGYFNFLISGTSAQWVKTDFEFMEISKMHRKYGKDEIARKPYLLTMMLSTINSYYGIFGYANSYSLRVSLYEKHFGVLKEFFLPKNSFRAFSISETARTAGGHGIV